MSNADETGAGAAAEPLVRVAPWVADCVVVCPIATAVLLVIGDYAWGPIVSVSSFLTVVAFATLDGLRTTPGYVAEAFSLFGAALLGALWPSVAMAACERRLADKVAAAAALFPIWMVVMLAPAGVIFQHSLRLDPSLHRAHLAADFIFLFSAAATSIALAYTIWARHHPDRLVRNPILPKRPMRKVASDAVRAPRGWRNQAPA